MGLVQTASQLFNFFFNVPTLTLNFGKQQKNKLPNTTTSVLSFASHSTGYKARQGSATPVYPQRGKKISHIFSHRLNQAMGIFISSLCPETTSWRQEDLEFKAFLNYITSLRHPELHETLTQKRERNQKFPVIDCYKSSHNGSCGHKLSLMHSLLSSVSST